MMIPTIHLNGTGKRELLNDVEAAFLAVKDAIEAVANMTVHGRDYYVQSPQAYPVARCEQDARLRRLREVRDELFLMFEKISEQGVK